MNRHTQMEERNNSGGESVVPLRAANSLNPFGFLLDRVSSKAADQVAFASGQEEEEETRTITQTFKFYDSGEKGYLYKSEYKLAFIVVMGFSPSKLELSQLYPKDDYSHIPFRLQPTDSDQPCLGIKLPQFIKLMKEKLSRQDSVDKSRAVFKTLDRNSNGYLTLSDIEYAMRCRLKIGKEFNNQHVLYQLFSVFDTNKDGMITYSDFCKVLQ